MPPLPSSAQAGAAAADEFRIGSIAFSLFSGSEIMKISELEISNRQLYEIASRQPCKDGPLDPRLGVSDKMTCEQLVFVTATYVHPLTRPHSVPNL